jgi:hypothetical protein
LIKPKWLLFFLLPFQKLILVLVLVFVLLLLLLLVLLLLLLLFVVSQARPLHLPSAILSIGGLVASTLAAVHLLGRAFDLAALADS